MVRKKLATDWQIDLAMLFGLGFPIWRGGLLWWSSQTRGLSKETAGHEP